MKKIEEKKNVKINPFPEKKCIKILYICNVSGGIGNAMRRWENTTWNGWALKLTVAITLL